MADFAPIIGEKTAILTIYCFECCGAVCQATVRQLSASPVALYGLLEDGLFERDIPLPAALFAGLLWNPETDFSELLRTCAQRSDVTLY